MILRSTSDKRYFLEKEITLIEFINSVIEKDEDKELKYYEVHLLENISTRNMVLYYQRGELKSHHTTFCKFEYKDYLNSLIDKGYFCDYIKVKHINSFDKDNSEEDNKIELQQVEKDLSDSIEEMIKEMQIESNRREVKEKFKWDRKNTTEEDIKDALKVVIEDYEKLKDNYSNLNFSFEREVEMNKKLNEKIKWLEYKLDLLTKRTEHAREIRRRSLGVKGESRFRI